MQEAVIREIQQLRLLMGSARDPRGRVFAQLADALRRNGELDEAWELVRRGVEEDPHFVPGHLVKGWVLQDRGELDEALAAYRRAVDLDPENPFGLHGVGALLRARGDDHGAELLDRARELHPAVEDSAPPAPEPLVPLHELPFLSLAELAPDGAATADLPFMSLAELAPDEPAAADAAAAVADEADPDADLPFMSLAELAPDVVEEAADAAPAFEDPAVEGAGAEAPVEDDHVEELAEIRDETAEAGPGDEDAAPAPAPEDADADATPATRTMAELLVSQDQVGRAVAIYEEILARDPDNRDIADRIQELQDELHPELSGAAEPAESGPSPFTWHEDDVVEADGETSTSGAGGEQSDAAGDAGGTAASYFGDLLSFSPRRDGGRTGSGAPAEGEDGGDAAAGGEDTVGKDR